jgi:hypothetical protein
MCPGIVIAVNAVDRIWLGCRPPLPSGLRLRDPKQVHTREFERSLQPGNPGGLLANAGS